ncbi:MAG: hypothetical protein ACREQ5_11580 [Candidatus Dormibacteria bacterium]
MSKQTNPQGKHPVCLQFPHDLYLAITSYSNGLETPRSKVIFNILRGFLGPLMAPADETTE